MKIITCSHDLDMAARYNLIRNPETERMSDHVGETFNIDTYMVREEAKGDSGEIVTITSFTSGGKAYATNSATFAREFMEMQDLAEECGEEVHRIRVARGVSKKGREYITCVLVG